ncbi:sensor domain-containing protein [Crassaminicella profunda]|uniref:sensor domain-containing protein n=1 Tax=Crassaminicella profunda TaxID=1286698 RepID=UPI001CA7A3F0|nr:EAL domain-containing protein [Crassaminicella profunda]QZY54678.1 EAL domain-containing protein [Crassaminicella profunda]
MKIKSALMKIIGNIEEFSLEYRILYILSLLSALLMIILVPINYAQNMEPIHIMALAVGAIIATIVFFLLKYRKIQCKLIYSIIVLCILTVFWFTNGGSYGSIPYYFTYSLTVSLIILRGKKRKFIFFMNIFVISVLIIAEYYYPHNIIYYQSLKDRYIDLFTGVLICLLILGIIVKIVIDNFDLERKKVVQKTVELKNKNIELEESNQLLSKKNVQIISHQNELMRALKELKESEKKFRSFFQTAIDMIYVLDQNGIILEMNDSAKGTLGYSEREMCHKSLAQFLTAYSKKTFYKELSILLNKGSKRCEMQFISKTNEVITVDCSSSVIYDESGDPKYIVVFQRDISKLKKNAEEIKYLAYHDMVTNLPNRRLGKDILQFAIRNALKKENMVGVMFVDLDRFKYINDSLGHGTGDTLLKYVGKRFKECVREDDSVVRLGGDEFMIILNNVNASNNVWKIADRMIKTFSKPFYLKEKEIHITCSIGIAMFPEHGKNVDNLLKNADMAMYQAKESGRNNFKFFDNILNNKVDEEIEIKEGIIKAIKKREFTLYYQPKIHINSSEIVGWEALVRWNHPTMGFISPAKFIPIAEQSGLIKNIDRLVLEMACKQIKELVDKGINPKSVAINISPNQFNDSTFIDTLDLIIDESGIDPTLLNLEITETAAMQDTYYAQMIFDQIKKRGISLSLDDFGTGYSSLNYLKSFPIDVLKIDKSFVDEICSDQVNKAIILATITMAKALNIIVVAEGVEIKEQLELLKRAGCKEYQGYLFSKPVPIEKMEKMLVKQVQ